MRILVVTAALSLLFAGCADPRGYGAPTQFQNDVDEMDDGSDDSQQNDDGNDNNDDDPNNDDPNNDDPVDGWDALPPDAADGSILEGVLNCGLLQGTHYKTFEKQGDIWAEIESEGDGPYEWAMPCMSRGGEGSRGDKFLTWDDEPSMYMNAAGLHHDLTPTQTTDRWMGEVYPMGESSRECLDNLADQGLTFPVAMTFEVTHVELR